ncbi:MAG: hypothetical protein U9Q68_00130 [Euryarchaeota archaeon]|nr:hypothetical protein [Euryarchaeota archaeon]
MWTAESDLLDASSSTSLLGSCPDMCRETGTVFVSVSGSSTLMYS